MEARKAFSKYGYHASLSDIAENSGIKKQTLYNYFKSKDQLFSEVLLDELKSYFEKIKTEIELHSDLEPVELLEFIYFQIVTYFKNDEAHRLWRWVMLIENEDVLTPWRDSLKHHEKLFVSLLEQIINDGQNKNKIRQCAVKQIIHGYIAAIHGALDGRMYYKEFVDPEKFTYNVWHTFVEGIRVKV